MFSQASDVDCVHSAAQPNLIIRPISTRAGTGEGAPQDRLIDRACFTASTRLDAYGTRMGSEGTRQSPAAGAAFVFGAPDRANSNYSNSVFAGRPVGRMACLYWIAVK